MDLLPSAEQRELVAAAAEFLDEQLPISGIRERRGERTAVAAEVWAAGAELGLLTLGLDERHGGSGRGLDDEALLFCELGKHLAPGPFLAGTLGARVAAQCGATELCARIGDGTATVGLAELRDDGAVGPGGVKGRFDLIDSAGCDHVLIVSRQGAALVAATEFAGAQGVEAIDPATRLASCSVTATEVAHWLPTEVESTWGRAMVLSAAMLAGIAEAVTDVATEHAKNRVQFGKPIGVNQAVKHCCADMAVRSEAALTQTFFAAVSVQSDRADTLFQILSAKSVAGRAAIDNGAACIQLHGGIGYTDEHDAHLYVKRANVLNHLFDEPFDVLTELLDQGAPQ